MDKDDVVRLVTKRLLECDENEGDVAMRFFVEHVLGVPRGRTYTEEQIAPIVMRHLTTAST